MLTLIFGIWMNLNQVRNLSFYPEDDRDKKYCAVYFINGGVQEIANRTCDEVAAEINKNTGKGK